MARPHRPNLNRDVTWVYNKLGTGGLKKSDAPSEGAWNLLVWAKEHRNEFMKTFVPKAVQAETDKHNSTAAKKKVPVNPKDTKLAEDLERLLLDITHAA